MDAAAQHTEPPGTAGYPPLWKTLALPKTAAYPLYQKRNEEMQTNAKFSRRQVYAGRPTAALILICLSL